MAKPTPIDIKKSISESVIDLFDTMLSMEAKFSEDETHPLEGNRMIGSLAFAGDIVGTINIHVSDQFSRVVTAAMLGMEVDEIEDEEEIFDVIREICNIIGGNLKTGFENANMPCAISTPSITRGGDFIVETLHMDRYERFAFLHEDDVVIVELAVKAAEAAASETKQQLKAVDISKFSRLDIISATGDSVIELFDVMLSMAVEISDTETLSGSDITRYMGSLTFAGEVLGNLSLQVSESFSGEMAGAMLGLEPGETQTPEEIKDVIGEVTNIIGGNLKAAFEDSGLKCRISPPNITSGTDFKFQTANMDRYERFSFQFNKNEILVEICVKIDESGQTRADDEAAAAEKESEPSLEQEENVSTSDNELEKKDTLEVESEAFISADNLGVILDIPIDLTVELGHSMMKIEELLSLGPGSTVPLENLEGEPLQILANDQLVAKGEVVVDREKYGIRITEIISRMDRIKGLK
jgi:flagellar motor switch protein FliN